MREVHAWPAPLWRRTFAWLVDATAIFAVVAGYLWIAAAVLGAKSLPSRLPGIDYYVALIRAWQSILVPGFILGVVLALAYEAAFAILRGGRTPGRWLMRIRLVDKNGSAPSPTRAILRAMLSTLSFGAFLGGIWLALFDRRGQTLHDRLTSTFVVRLH